MTTCDVSMLADRDRGWACGGNVARAFASPPGSVPASPPSMAADRTAVATDALPQDPGRSRDLDQQPQSREQLVLGR